MDQIQENGVIESLCHAQGGMDPVGSLIERGVTVFAQEPALVERNNCHGPRKVRIMCPIENPESRVISAYKRVGRLLKSAHRMR